MSTRAVRFKQVDVFTSVAFKGNPLAVIFDADDLSTERMQSIARWTNLSETAFLLRPTDPRADYRVRIFTTATELPFAGHPTLGTAHALLESGYATKTPGKLVQECGVGLVTLAQDDRGRWAFAAPPARITPLDDAERQRLTDALAPASIDFSAPPCAVDNGAPWLIVRLRDAAQCLSLTLAPAAKEALTALVAETGTHGIVVYGPHENGVLATFELRALLFGAENIEDPVTGSANAALAMLLTAQNKRPGDAYTVRQGTALDRDGRVSIAYDDRSDGSPVWIGGDSVTVIDGTFRF
ncbi:PhzF family phenazine biosynthesis protein [Caballeronia concitans]|uniref:Phenazine biosynthesis PhzC/PhzF protein n=1 Tax=Caballeronia concitans TaxID=1777133 RepID=A0A658QSX0_9BURK|nr:PhzF family phenazine biosynthesis protein [Caballeronia concitans]KIG11087.1 phenazine biosynthesis protein PhzF family [Burkholderia sp. MR1]SAL17315.1 phenazine biosynthesis PhzC/PhzF protein [Caballeronia concitans]